MPIINKTEWKQFLEKHPHAHILQDAVWGELKSEFGWEVEHVIVGDVGAQILLKPLPLGFSIAYIPRGPVTPPDLDWRSHAWEGFLAEVDAFCRKRRAILLKVEPDLWAGDPAPDRYPPPGFQPSSQTIQPPRTILISLSEDEDAILGRMKSKTRYNIRLAGRKGVVVRQSSDVEGFYKILTGTATRAEFGVHSLAYYQKVFELFVPEGKCKLFVAEYKGQPLAGVMVFARGERAWYFYGASSSEHRDLMPTYLVQWEAMCWAKEQGCTSYDLWGVPDADIDILEEHFLERRDGLWSVYRFKRGFGGELERTQGPWDRVYQPFLYRLYSWWVGRGG